MFCLIDKPMNRVLGASNDFTKIDSKIYNTFDCTDNDDISVNSTIFGIGYNYEKIFAIKNNELYGFTLYKNDEVKKLFGSRYDTKYTGVYQKLADYNNVVKIYNDGAVWDGYAMLDTDEIIACGRGHVGQLPGTFSDWKVYDSNVALFESGSDSNFVVYYGAPNKIRIRGIKKTVGINDDKSGIDKTFTLPEDISYITHMPLYACILIGKSGKIYVIGWNKHNCLGVNGGEYISSFAELPMGPMSEEKVVSIYNSGHWKTGSFTLFRCESGNVYGVGLNINGCFGLGHNNNLTTITKLPVSNCEDIKILTDSNSNDSAGIPYINYVCTDGVYHCGPNHKTITKTMNYIDNGFVVVESDDGIMDFEKIIDGKFATTNKKKAVYIDYLFKPSERLNGEIPINTLANPRIISSIERGNPIEKYYAYIPSTVSDKEYTNISDLCKNVDFFDILGNCLVSFQRNNSLIWETIYEGNIVPITNTLAGCTPQTLKDVRVDVWSDLKNIKFRFVLDKYDGVVDKIQMQFDAHGSFRKLDARKNINRTSLQVTTNKDIRIMKTNILINQ